VLLVAWSTCSIVIFPNSATIAGTRHLFSFRSGRFYVRFCFYRFGRFIRTAYTHDTTHTATHTHTEVVTQLALCLLPNLPISSLSYVGFVFVCIPPKKNMSGAVSASVCLLGVARPASPDSQAQLLPHQSLPWTTELPPQVHHDEEMSGSCAPSCEPASVSVLESLMTLMTAACVVSSIYSLYPVLSSESLGDSHDYAKLNHCNPNMPTKIIIRE